MIRPLWTAFGGLALALAMLGVVLPILPTTPLVILAAFAFGKGSPRFEAMLVSHRFFGPIITEWRAHGAIAPRYKAMAVGMMGAVLLLSVWMQVSGTVIAIQAICIAGAAAFVLSRPNGPR